MAGPWGFEQGQQLDTHIHVHDPDDCTCERNLAGHVPNTQELQELVQISRRKKLTPAIEDALTQDGAIYDAPKLRALMRCDAKVMLG